MSVQGMMDDEWLTALRLITYYGRPAAPRNNETREHLHSTVVVSMPHCVLTNPARELSYQFMAAEAYWILTGDNSVAGIAPWNKHISKFSDDGKTFFGAYGPKVVEQLPYVVQKLKSDPWSRQAGLTLWRENPPQTRDVPCTVAIFANIRNQRLNLHVFMRSSDVWLGLPYDIFNFSMIGHLICCLLNSESELAAVGNIIPGAVYLTAMSMHLYADQYEQARKVLESPVPARVPAVPEAFAFSKTTLLETLYALRDTKKGDARRWWEQRP